MSDIAKREFLKKKLEIVKRQEFEERLQMHLYQKVYLNYNNFEHIIKDNWIHWVHLKSGLPVKVSWCAFHKLNSYAKYVFHVSFPLESLFTKQFVKYVTCSCMYAYVQ